jgi:tRNA(His) 5'-end guanylyltransferase
MSRCIEKEEDIAPTQAQQVVCGFMVRACQQAIYDLALDEEREPEVRRRAIAALREILADWREARKSIRAELGGRRATFTAR